MSFHHNNENSGWTSPLLTHHLNKKLGCPSQAQEQHTSKKKKKKEICQFPAERSRTFHFTHPGLTLPSSR
jgi:hypothetical protein